MLAFTVRCTPSAQERSQLPAVQSRVQVPVHLTVQVEFPRQVSALMSPSVTPQVEASQVTSPFSATVMVQLLIASQVILSPLPPDSVQAADVHERLLPAPSEKAQWVPAAQLALPAPPHTPSVQMAFIEHERLQFIVEEVQVLDEKSQLLPAGQLQSVPTQVALPPPHAKLATATATARAIPAS